MQSTRQGAMGNQKRQQKEKETKDHNVRMPETQEVKKMQGLK